MLPRYICSKLQLWLHIFMRQLQRILMSLRIFYISIRHDKLGSKAERKIEQRDTVKKRAFLIGVDLCVSLGLFVSV